jgi:hypothetical protein
MGPAQIADTVSDLDLARLLTAAQTLARQLEEVGGELSPDQRLALPTAMAAYITADLAAISPPTGQPRPN